MDPKISKAGKALGVKPKDVKDIKKQRCKAKLVYPIAGAIIAVGSTALGFLAGKADPICTNCDGYPFAAAAAVVPTKNRPLLVAILVTALISVIGFAAAYKTGQSIFAYGIRYNVYKR